MGLPIIRLVQRLSMVLTLGCCIYMAYFLLFKSQDNSVVSPSENNAMINTHLIQPAPVLDLKPYNPSESSQQRDVFSLTAAINPAGTPENTPKGELPAHLKVVGILIAHPSQVVIEDTNANQTYFIEEGKPQNGIKIVQVKNDQMTINYQGQDIPLSVSKTN